MSIFNVKKRKIEYDNELIKLLQDTNLVDNVSKKNRNYVNNKSKTNKSNTPENCTQISNTIQKIFNNIKVTDQGKTNLCTIITTLNLMEYAYDKQTKLSSNNTSSNINIDDNGINLSLYNGYMKSFLTEIRLNPNYRKNYNIMSLYSNNNFWENKGFSVKHTIIMGFYGVCYNTDWKNIPQHVKHMPQYGSPLLNNNPLLKNNYKYDLSKL